MGTNKIGRNEPCPCGSGRKYKHCCGRSGAPPRGGPAKDLKQAISDQTFASVDEANALAARHVQRANETGRDEFDGLSPSQTAVRASGIAALDRIRSVWRICFQFVDGDAYDVEICDYH